MIEQYKPIGGENLVTAMEIILQSQFASVIADKHFSIPGSLSDHALEAVGEILQAKGIPVIDDADEEVPKLIIYGKTFIRRESVVTQFYETELGANFVLSYLEAKNEFPDAIINYRLDRGEYSIERPNPDYDPSMVRGKNPKFLSIMIAGKDGPMAPRV